MNQDYNCNSNLCVVHAIPCMGMHVQSSCPVLISCSPVLSSHPVLLSACHVLMSFRLSSVCLLTMILMVAGSLSPTATGASNVDRIQVWLDSMEQYFQAHPELGAWCLVIALAYLSITFVIEQKNKGWAIIGLIITSPFWLPFAITGLFVLGLPLLIAMLLQYLSDGRIEFQE